MIWFANLLLNTVFATTLISAVSESSYVVYSVTLNPDTLPNGTYVLDDKDCHILGRYITFADSSSLPITQFLKPTESYPQPCGNFSLLVQ